MKNTDEVEVYKNICEKLIEENPTYDEKTKNDLKLIIKSNDSAMVVLKRLSGYFATKQCSRH